MSISWHNEFSWPETGEWVELIKQSVKDPKELEKLIWATDEGFDLNSFYRKNDIEKLEISALTKPNNQWEIRQAIYTDREMAANQSALKALENGADSLLFIGKEIGTENEINALFKGIHLDWIPAHYDFGESNVAWLYLLVDFFEQQGYDLTKMKGSVNFDPLAELLLNGNYLYSETETWNVFQSVVETTGASLPHFKVVNVNAHLIRESGGTAVHEIASALSMAVEYIDKAEQKNIAPETIWKHLQFHLSTGPDYFIEIAKLRAFKVLVQRIATAYKIENVEPTIHVVGTKRNKTIYDAHNNLIRATLEAMSAAMGGMDAMTIFPFDENYQQPEEFSYRLTRNIQLLLKEEAHLDKVVDPAAGSYYLESITEKLIQSGWKLFLDMEKQGGFEASLKNKFLQPLVQLNAEKQSKEIIGGKRVSVGTNKYMLKTETKIGEYTIVHPADISPEKKMILPLKPTRLTEKIEIERMKLEAQHTKELN